MSQTETVLLLVLGFALASLLALFIGRVAWRVALKLGARNMKKQVPSSLKDLQSERDRLRADYAMLSQKLGSHLETVKARMAEQMAEVARSRNRVQSLAEDIAARDKTIADRDAEIASLKATVTGLEARVAMLQADLSAAPSASSAAVPDQLQTAIDHLTQMAGENATARLPETGEGPKPETVAAADLAGAEKETAALQAELARLDSLWSEKLEGPNAGGAAAGVANVVSLAQRLRGQTKDVAG